MEHSIPIVGTEIPAIVVGAVVIGLWDQFGYGFNQNRSSSTLSRMGLTGDLGLLMGLEDSISGKKRGVKA